MYVGHLSTQNKYLPNGKNSPQLPFARIHLNLFNLAPTGGYLSCFLSFATTNMLHIKFNLTVRVLCNMSLAVDLLVKGYIF